MKKLHTLLTATALAASVVSFGDTGLGNLTLPHSGPLMIPLPNTGAASLSGPNTLTLTSAAADTTEDTSKPAVGYKIGQMFPSDSTVKSVFGNFWQLGIDLEGKGDTTRSLIFLDMNFAGASASDGQGNSVSLDLFTIGVGYGYKYVFSPGESIRPYAGAGLGLYLNSGTVTATAANGAFGSGSTSSTNVGFKLFAGVTFQQHFLAELGYQQAGSLSGINLNGTSFSLGYKF